MAWLDDHPPVRTQFRDPRRQKPSGVIVVHTAENLMDKVGPDTGAEAVANFIRVRDTPGSYHELVDSDSTVGLVRWDCEAFHDGTGTNPHSFGLSFACSAADWPGMSAAKRERFILRGARRAADYAGWIRKRQGVIIPAARITRDESSNRVPGFFSHAQRDPQRRTDPGQGFPWSMFLDAYSDLMNGAPAPQPPEDDDVRKIVKGDQSGEWWITDGILKRHVNDRTEAKGLAFNGLALLDNGEAFVWPQALVDDITVVPRAKALS
jgi:hypothetical protein